MDRGDARRQPVGALRAHGGRDGGWSMDSDGPRGPGTGAEITGVVTDTLPSAMYRVRLDGGGSVTAHIADRIDRNFIRVLVGDRVKLELSPRDRGRGRIVEKVKL